MRRSPASSALRSPALEPRLAAMAGALVHRGPDAAGVWADAAAGIGLAHRRLSILDLSPQGAQPMVSACGRLSSVTTARFTTPAICGANSTPSGRSRLARPFGH